MTHHQYATRGTDTNTQHTPAGPPESTPQYGRGESDVPAEILELLQRHAEELLRTGRDTRAHSAAEADAPIVDPWALLGTGGTAADGTTHSGTGPAAALQKLLAIGEQLLAKLESPLKNPFDFLP